MLFNSYVFIFVFLPATWIVWFFLNRAGRTIYINAWLALSSLVFYGFWNPRFVVILLLSAGVNFLIAKKILAVEKNFRKPLLILGILFNILLLGYYKYTGFLFSNLGFSLGNIVLPLGISFYTFQQIAYLVDSYNRDAEEPDFIKYILFITFFPHCIAGPIVHHREMMPQFGQAHKNVTENFTIGLTIFVIGLFKKVVIADPLGSQSTSIFFLAAHGYSPTLIEAWGAALCYTFQIYFDFSGYSDMAVGLARMFGIKLPINFASPYKAVSFIDFWRRWHITLSRFLRNYIYIPLGGNRHGKSRQVANILVTMLIGGFWHGASWMMIIWGMMHGALLAVNHIIRWLKFPKIPLQLVRALIFLTIVFTWVPFRSESLPAMTEIYQGMLGLNGLVIPDMLGWIVDFLIPNLHYNTGGLNFNGNAVFFLILIAAAITWFFPNTYQWMQRTEPALPVKDYPETNIEVKHGEFAWRANPGHALIISLLFFLSLLKLTDVSEFIYFQF